MGAICPQVSKRSSRVQTLVRTYRPHPMGIHCYSILILNTHFRPSPHPLPPSAGCQYTYDYEDALARYFFSCFSCGTE